VSSRILVIDDSPTIRRVVSSTLQTYGYETSAADRGDTGIEQARAFGPDLILLDVGLPDQRGLDVARTLHEDVLLRDIPIVLLLTRSDQFSPGEVSGLGIVGTLNKPFAPHVLTDEVGAVLETYGHASREATSPSMSAYSDGPAGSEASEGADLFLPKTEQSPMPDFGSLLSLDPSSESPRAPMLIQHRPRPPARNDGSQEGAPVDEGSAVDEVMKVFSDALFVRGLNDADQVVGQLFSSVMDQFSEAIAAEFLKRQIGLEMFTGPVPSLYGDLAVVPLPEVLQLLNLQGQTGVLEVSVNDARFEVHFKKGRLLCMRGRNVRAVNRLGQYFLLLGALTKEQLQEALDDFDGQQPLGTFLLGRGLIKDTDLRAAVRAQAEDLMYEMLRMERGVFGLRREEGLIEDLPFSGFSVDELLFDGLRRVDEQSTIEQHVPSPDVVLQVGRDASLEGLRDEELTIMNALQDGARSVHALADQLGLHDEEAMKIAYRLVVTHRAALVMTADGQGGHAPLASTEEP